MLSQLFHVGDQMRGGIALKARIEGAGVWPAPPAVALVKEHKAVGTGIKQPAVPGDTSRTRAAVQDDGWLPMWIAAGLPVDEIAVIHLQEAVLVRLDLRIQIGHDSPASRSSRRRTLCRCDAHRCRYWSEPTMIPLRAPHQRSSPVPNLLMNQGAPFPMRQPVYHTSCHYRKWHRSTIRGEVSHSQRAVSAPG